MKKCLSLFMCILFVLSFTACGEEEVTPDAYIGEGLLTQLTLLVKNNQRLYADVFVASTLNADKSKPVEKNGIKWLPVTDSSFSSYTDIENTVKAVFTADCAEKILSEYDFYADIEGKLCIKSDAAKSSDAKHFELNPQVGGKVISKSANEIRIKYEFVKDESKKSETFVFKNLDGGWRLNKFYKIG